jgi:hypothetical protein
MLCANLTGDKMDLNQISQLRQRVDAPPYSITKDSSFEQYNDLFKLLFKNKANKALNVFENATKEQLLKLVPNKTLAINITSSGVFLCVNIDGKIYQIQFAITT